VRQKRVYAAPANIFGWDRTGARTSLQSLQAAKIFIGSFLKYWSWSYHEGILPQAFRYEPEGGI